MRGKAPVPASSDQQGGQSGKIHFIESTLFWAFTPNFPALGLWGRGWGRLRPAGRPDLI